jgi:hypothetical protein
MHLALPAELSTQRLVLRRWRKSDAPALKTVLDGNLEHLRAWLP